MLRRVTHPGSWVVISWVLFEDPASPGEFSRPPEHALGLAQRGQAGRASFQIGMAGRRAAVLDELEHLLADRSGGQIERRLLTAM